MSTSLIVAFVGAGTVAGLHAAAVARTRGVELAGVHDLDPARGRQLVHHYGGQLYPTYDALLADDRVQAVAVLSPLEAHYSHAAAALEAGKHVLIEKPVAATPEEIDDLVERATLAGRVCMPAHNYIYLPGMRQLRRAVVQGDFGTVTAGWVLYNLHHPPEVAAKYPGVLRQIMTHHFYSVIYLLGRPVQLTALVSETRQGDRRLDREDQAAVLLQMEGGALVNLFASFAADDQTADPWTVLFKVLGTQGGGSYSWRDQVILSAGAGLTWRYPAYEESFACEWDYFVHECIAAGEAPLSTLADARLAQTLIAAAEASVAEGRTVPI